MLFTSTLSRTTAAFISSNHRPPVQRIGPQRYNTVRLLMTFQQPDTPFPYTPPAWASRLTNVPEKRLQLANLPTPVQLIGANRSSTRHQNNNNNNST
eukprot:scaffold19595_cov97-Skeletonema_menzelii.AAC.1